MEIEDFRETLKLLGEAHTWRPIGDLLATQLYRAIADIPDEDYLRLVGDFVALPNQTPAHLLQAIKGLRGRLLKEREAAASPKFKGWRDMTEAERNSYAATIARVKGNLADELARLYAAGRIPTTKIQGFSSVGSLLAGQILKSGLDELQLEARLEQEPAPAVDDWQEAA